MKKFNFTEFVLKILNERWELSDSEIYELAGKLINIRVWEISKIVRYSNSMQIVLRWLRKDGRIIEASRKTLDDGVSEEIVYKLPLPLQITEVKGKEVKEGILKRAIKGAKEDWENFKSIFKD